MKKIKGQICSSHLILVYTIHPPFVHVCTKFQPSRPQSSWEKCEENFNTWILEKEKIKNKGMNKQQQPDSGIHPPTVHVCTKFQPSRLQSSWEKCEENFNTWILEKEKIKGWISSSSLILVYTIHPPTVHVCTKFQPSRLHNSWYKSVTKNFNV